MWCVSGSCFDGNEPEEFFFMMYCHILVSYILRALFESNTLMEDSNLKDIFIEKIGNNIEPDDVVNKLVISCIDNLLYLILKVYICWHSAIHASMSLLYTIWHLNVKTNVFFKKKLFKKKVTCFYNDLRFTKRCYSICLSNFNHKLNISRCYVTILGSCQKQSM